MRVARLLPYRRSDGSVEAGRMRRAGGHGGLELKARRRTRNDEMNKKKEGRRKKVSSLVPTFPSF